MATAQHKIYTLSRMWRLKLGSNNGLRKTTACEGYPTRINASSSPLALPLLLPHRFCRKIPPGTPATDSATDPWRAWHLLSQGWCRLELSPFLCDALINLSCFHQLGLAHSSLGKPNIKPIKLEASPLDPPLAQEARSHGALSPTLYSEGTICYAMFKKPVYIGLF